MLNKINLVAESATVIIGTQHIMGGQGAFNGTQFVWWEKWLQI
jgi:hypothetical protein